MYITHWQIYALEVHVHKYSLVSFKLRGKFSIDLCRCISIPVKRSVYSGKLFIIYILRNTHQKAMS